MDYAPILRKALGTATGKMSLAETLEQIDVLNKSVPTLEELNSALGTLGRDSVTTDAYRKAVSENHERAVRELANNGVSPERQREILRRYSALMGKP